MSVLKVLVKITIIISSLSHNNMQFSLVLNNAISKINKRIGLLKISCNVFLKDEEILS